MVVDYTSRWKGFQFRSPVYLGNHEPVPNEFDLVKWEQHEPREVIDGKTGEKIMTTENCFSIGRLEWNPKEECFEFRSIGMRFFEYYESWLSEWILAFAEMKKLEITKDYNED